MTSTKRGYQEGNHIVVKTNKKSKATPEANSDTDLPTQISDMQSFKEILKKAPSLNKYVGLHVSMSGGLFKAPLNAAEVEARSFAMFLRSQRSWKAKPLEETQAEKFKNTCLEVGYSMDMILPHGIYLMNCGSPDPETLAKSRSTLIDELKRCEMLGLPLYNFHPGSTCGKISVNECVKLIAESINMAHQETKSVTTLIENMSCQGNTVSEYCTLFR